LCHNIIEDIAEDKSGNIYFNTPVGVNKFDGRTFSILSITDKPDNEWKLQPDDIWFRGAQDSGVVYRYDGKYLFRLKFPATKAGEEYISRHPRSKYPNLKSNPYDVYNIYKDSKGNIWFGTASLGVCRFDGKSFNWISEEELGYGDLAFGVRSVIEDKDGKFWFSNSMYRYDVDPGDSSRQNKNGIKFIREKEFGGSGEYDKDDCTYFLSGVVDSTGALWIVTYSAGVWRYDGKDLTHYSVKEGDNVITLFTIYKDNQGALWLGTHENGVYKFSGRTFERYKP
jgi:ligand-binding sensor domain-containing protein